MYSPQQWGSSAEDWRHTGKFRHSSAPQPWGLVLMAVMAPWPTPASYRTTPRACAVKSNQTFHRNTQWLGSEHACLARSINQNLAPLQTHKNIPLTNQGLFTTPHTADGQVGVPIHSCQFTQKNKLRGKRARKTFHRANEGHNMRRSAR